MSDALLSAPPYSPRDEAALLAELDSLTRRHLEGCPEYRRIWPDYRGAKSIDDLPYLHVGLFKRLSLRTGGEEVRAGRVLLSSSTSGAAASRIPLDARGSESQSTSTRLILEHHLGAKRRPLLILDSQDSLRRAGEVSARLAAALSLKPLSSELHFLLRDANDPASLDTQRLLAALQRDEDLIVYGFTWMLHLAWGARVFTPDVVTALHTRRIAFVHSGGWKKLEALAIPREHFERRLLERVAPGSVVLDYYGLVEQVGVIYPLCPAGARHVPRWAAVRVRDPWTHECLSEGEGQLQLLNTLAHAAPHHSVLTEDMGRLAAGPCPCGNPAPAFVLAGRMQNAEIRGCANV